MPRTARVVFPSMPYHIISRGNNREPIFEEKEDLKKYPATESMDMKREMDCQQILRLPTIDYSLVPFFLISEKQSELKYF